MSKRYNRPSISSVVTYWVKNAKIVWPELNNRIDWNQPSCWRCRWSPVEEPYKHENTVVAAWSNSKFLERSHLIDHQLGGAFTPDNLALLCRCCNAVMPVFSSKNEAIRWINAAASAQETIDELNNNSAAKRTQVALARMAQQGKRVGEIPYGFKLAEDGVHLVEDATEQRLVQTIRDLKAKGLTWAQVAEEMNSRGFVTKKGRPWSWRTAQAVVV